MQGCWLCRKHATSCRVVQNHLLPLLTSTPLQDAKHAKKKEEQDSEEDEEVSGAMSTMDLKNQSPAAPFTFAPAPKGQSPFSSSEGKSVFTFPTQPAEGGQGNFTFNFAQGKKGKGEDNDDEDDDEEDEDEDEEEEDEARVEDSLLYRRREGRGG